MPVMEVTQANKAYFIGRIKALKPEATARWGRMTPAEMLAHLRRMLEISLGEVAVADASTLLTRTVGRWLTINGRDFPKGKMKAPPEAVPTDVADFETEVKRLQEAMERFMSARDNAPDLLEPHPHLGMMKMVQWSKFHGKHMDHHFSQFGV